MKIYKLTPALKDYIWGGERLKEYGKTGDGIIAESWELSFHKDGLSTVCDRPLCEIAGVADIGRNASDFPFFPVLVKFIDARQNLSVQVHPSDKTALEKEGSFGKTEMWYIVDADEGAGIYLGFNETLTEDALRKAIESNTVEDHLRFVPVKAGECYFIPAGTVHAIGAGCLIAEIQQNSNLTYRMYDYGRLGKDGKPRELHVEKALAVANLERYRREPLLIKSADGDIIGASKYFTTTKFTLDGNKKIKLDKNSYRAIVSLSCEGEMMGQDIKRGDTYFISADDGEITLSGKGELLMVETRKYYVGIDLGGTFIKGGIVDDLGNILVSDKIPTESDKGADTVVENIAKLTNIILEKAGLDKSDVVGLGMGVPGMINGRDGVVIYSNNLAWKDFAISKKVEELTGIPSRIANDANVAALGEVKFGGGRGLDTVVMITLGTGVGGGIVIDGRLFEGNMGAGAELGHSAIVAGEDGELCTCGRRGCLEAYASATALIRETKRAMEAHKDSKMWDIGSLDSVNGETAFRYAEGDEYAKGVVNRYIEMLGCGLTNIANVFRPEAILIGGGVSAQGESLIKPLQKYVKEHIFAGDMGPEVKILTATLQNRAGLVGAAALWM